MAGQAGVLGTAIAILREDRLNTGRERGFGHGGVTAPVVVIIIIIIIVVVVSSAGVAWDELTHASGQREH